MRTFSRETLEKAARNKSGGQAAKIILLVMGGLYAVIGTILGLFFLHARNADLRIISLGGEADAVLPVLALVFSLLGWILLAVGIAMHLAAKKRARLKEDLRAFGRTVAGKVVKVQTDHAIRVNRVSPRIAHVEAEFPSGKAVVKSRRLWRKTVQAGDEVQVLFDPMDEGSFVVDIED